MAGLRIKAAAVQLHATYGQVKANLARAEELAARAAAAGARLVVLPETFNTGYAYDRANLWLAEPPGGATHTWLLETAARLDVHLAGSFLLRRGEHVTNTLLLAAPDGRAWEYDKLYPWGWERAYFRPGARPVVAETDLGRVGLMICWDVAHRSLFRAYGGRVQLLVASSCPPAMERMAIRLPNGAGFGLADLGPLGRAACRGGSAVVDGDLRAQAAWLGVPLVSAMQHGVFSSAVPRPRASFLLALLLAPRLWPLARHVAGATVSAPYNEHTLVAGGDGRVLARAGAGDDLALAELDVPAAPPRPQGRQPRMQLSPAAHLLSGVLAWVSRREYRRRTC